MKFTSIRLKVILLVVAMAIPIVLLGIAGTLYYQSILKQNIQADELTIAKTISVMTPEYMNSSQLYLKSIADRPLVIKAMEDNDTAFLQSMAAYANETDRINSAYFTDNKGNVVASTPNISDMIGSNVLDNPYVGAVLQSSDPVIGDAVPGYDKMPVVPIGVPIKDNDTTLGVLVGTVDLNVYSKMIRQGAVNDQQIVYLVNRTGHIMIHNDPQYVNEMANFSSVTVVQNILRGEAGVADYYNPVENESRLGAYVPIEPMGWGVVVGLPTSIAYQPAWNAGYLFVGGTALLTLGAILLGLFLANGITSPILRLSLATKKISDNSDFTGLIPLDRNDEIGDLAHSFKGMVDDLQTKQEELETQTEELEVQNEEIRENNAELQKQILDRKRAEEALSESEERFRALADNIPNLAWMADPKGWIFWYNKQWYDYTGTTLEEMQGWGWQKVHHPDYVDAVTKDWSASIAAGKPYDNIFPLKGKDGNYRWFLTRVRPIRDEKGDIVSWFGTNTDITERKTAEEALRLDEVRLKALADLNDMVYSSEKEIFDFALESSMKITGSKIGVFDTVSPDESMAFIRSVTKDFMEGCKVEEPLNMDVHRGGIWTNVFKTHQPLIINDYSAPHSGKKGLPSGHMPLKNVLIVPLIDKGRIVLLCMVGNKETDYTDDDVLQLSSFMGGLWRIIARKHAEDEVIKAKAQAELYLDLMGHDISNMHQIIMGQLELAQEILETDCKLDAVDKTLIDTSLETLDRSAKLIDNVRNLQKLSHGEFREEVIDLDGLLSNIIREFDVIVPNESIKLESNGLHYVKANKLLHDVFTNLIGNAIKHSNENNLDITIKLDRVNEKGKSLYRVSIEDTGPGISDDMKEKVFNRLQRGKTDARGMGLGLYLVKTLVESFGGFVKVEDRVEGDYTKGAKFIVYLPIMGGELLDE